MSRLLAIVVAIVAYAIFFATFLYLVVFVGDFSFATLTVDHGPGGPPLTAALVDIGLIALFGLQHSVMARQGFKRWWTRIVPAPIERSVFVLATSIVLIVIFLLWRPIHPIVWDVTRPAFKQVLWALFWVGWLTVLISTFFINHFELFGLQQAWLHYHQREAEPPQLREPGLYQWVRHPIYLGFFFAFWAIPTMTVGHLLLAIGLSVYMLIGIWLEERDLVAFHGAAYHDYRGRVGMLIPRLRRRSAG
ncbi:MAG TPA: isoprenylcysteine carboxylmethyltransferase family protein [Sphingomicrobium sp.]